MKTVSINSSLIYFLNPFYFLCKDKKSIQYENSFYKFLKNIRYSKSSLCSGHP